MKNLHFLIILTIILYSCASPNKIARESIHNAIMGQNEMVVFKRLGAPARSTPGPDGGKILIYEFHSKGMFLTPNKSNITYSSKRDLTGNREGLVFKSNVNTVTNDPKYTIYAKDVSCLKVYLDKQGNAIRLEENLPKEQLEIYHERFKHFLPYKK